MTRLPRVVGTKVISALERAGFFVKRTRGSHHMLKRDDGKGTVVPVHRRDIIRPALLRKILRDCELTPEEYFVDLFQEIKTILDDNTYCDAQLWLLYLWLDDFGE